MVGCLSTKWDKDQFRILHLPSNRQRTRTWLSSPCRSSAFCTRSFTSSSSGSNAAAAGALAAGAGAAAAAAAAAGGGGGDEAEVVDCCSSWGSGGGDGEEEDVARVVDVAPAGVPAGGVSAMLLGGVCDAG